MVEDQIRLDARKAKNERISETIRKTLLRRESQKCKVFETKVDYSHLKKTQIEQLSGLFREAKWFYNATLGLETPGIMELPHDYYKTSSIKHLNKDKQEDIKELVFLTSSIKDGIVNRMKSNIKSLSSKKKNGAKIGKLKFKSEFNSIPLKQYGITHKIKNRNSVKIQGISGNLRVRGLGQFFEPKAKNRCDIANAVLVRKASGYYIKFTTFWKKPINETADEKLVVKKDKKILASPDSDFIGIDMGIKDNFTMSDGTKRSFSVREPDRLRTLQVKLERQSKASKGYWRTRMAIRKTYEKMGNRKDDFANKFVHEIKKNHRFVCIQDEMLNKWKICDIGKGSSRKIQHSVLGRVKSKLKSLKTTIIVDKSCPTTKQCSVCGELNHSMTVNDRIFVCPHCGATEDRDIHAAKNMILFAKRQIEADRLESKRVENETSMAVSSDNAWIRPTKHEAARSLA
jgi:putative transposase